MGSKAEMKQLEFFQIPSPCIGVCESGPRGYCKGCYRSRDERRYWNECAIEVKRKIIVACAQRKKRHLSRKKDVDKTLPPKQGTLFGNSSE